MPPKHTLDVPDHEISFALDADRPLSHEEWQAYRRRQLDEQRRADREKRAREDQIRFKREDEERVRRIREEGDPRQPPEYRGQVWDHPTSMGVMHTATPPLRDDPQAPPTEAFIDFQRYAGERNRADNPDDYCVECRIRYRPSPICTWCGSARQDPLADAPRNRILLQAGDTHRCRSCTKSYAAKPPICGPCIDKKQQAEQPELQAAATVATVRKGRKGSVSKKGAGMAQGVYPL